MVSGTLFVGEISENGDEFVWMVSSEAGPKITGVCRYSFEAHRECDEAVSVASKRGLNDELPDGS